MASPIVPTNSSQIIDGVAVAPQTPQPSLLKPEEPLSPFVSTELLTKDPATMGLNLIASTNQTDASKLKTKWKELTKAEKVLKGTALAAGTPIALALGVALAPIVIGMIVGYGIGSEFASKERKVSLLSAALGGIVGALAGVAAGGIALTAKMAGLLLLPLFAGPAGWVLLAVTLTCGIAGLLIAGRKKESPPPLETRIKIIPLETQSRFKNLMASATAKRKTDPNISFSPKLTEGYQKSLEEVQRRAVAVAKKINNNGNVLRKFIGSPQYKAQLVALNTILDSLERLLARPLI